MIDVVIYDTVSSPQPWDDSKPCGGSEKQLLCLKRALEGAGCSVLITNARPRDLRCRALIVSRYSSAPAGIHADCVVSLAQDQEPHLRSRVGTVVCVSEWQRKHIRGDVVIYPFLDAHPDLHRWVRFHNTWAFPCTENKGWRATVDAWRAEKSEPDVLKWYDPRKTSPFAMQHAIASAEGLFIRNTYPECFPMTVQIGAQAGCRMDIKCVGHAPCGIVEAQIPRDLSVDALLPQWLKVLHLD